MSDNLTIAQRINDLRGLCASNRITLKELAAAADVPYKSMINNLLIGMVSEERMTLLEETALRLRDDRKMQPQGT